jgi:hypothetical protein
VQDDKVLKYPHPEDSYFKAAIPMKIGKTSTQQKFHKSTHLEILRNSLPIHIVFNQAAPLNHNSI